MSQDIKAFVAGVAIALLSMAFVVVNAQESSTKEALEPTTRVAEPGYRVPVEVSIPVKKTKVGHYNIGGQAYDVFIAAEPTSRPYQP
jgi:hypothetical protein